MPGLDVTANTLVRTALPYPTSVAELAARLKARGEVEISQALLLLQKSSEDVHRVLRQNPPTLREFVVNGADGIPVVRLGNLPTADGQMFYGAQVDALYAGDPLNTGDPAQAILSVTPDGHVQVGSSGWVDVIDPYGNDAAWLGSQFDTLPVTGAVNNGAGLIRLTVTGHTLLTGDRPRVLNVGGVPNATGIFTVTKIGADTVDLQGSVWDGVYTSGGSIDRILHVTDAVDNGSGIIRLTILLHGYERGDTVAVRAVGGVPAATGQWIIDRVDDNHIDLNTSVWAGVYTSGGTVLRYAGGGQFQNISIGPSFWDYRLRAFPDGSLKINNALISLKSAGGEILLDPTLTEIIARTLGLGTNFEFRVQGGAMQELIVDDNGFVIPGTTALEITPYGITLRDITGAPGIALDATAKSIVTKGKTDAYELWVNGTKIIDHTLAATNLAVVDSNAYKVAGVPGIDTFQNVVEDIAFTTASFVTSVTGPGVSSYSTAIAVIGATATPKLLVWNAGLLTSNT